LSIKTGLVGVGKFGERHCQVLTTLPDVDFRGVFDLNTARNREMARTYNSHAFDSLDALCEDVEAVVIAAPTSDHFDIARFALETGRHVLVEKPMTPAIAEAERLVLLAEEQKLCLHVGHIERFNPAFAALKSEALTPAFIECRRMAPFDARCTDVSVILDLMIHDLDLVLNLMAGKVTEVEAVGYRGPGGCVDFAYARVAFERDRAAVFTASRIADTRIRKMHCLQPDALFVADFLERKAQKMVLPGDTHDASLLTAAGSPSATDHETTAAAKLETLPVPATNALAAELTAFVASIDGEEAAAQAAEGSDGLRALTLAKRIEAAIEIKSEKSLENDFRIL